MNHQTKCFFLVILALATVTVSSMSDVTIDFLGCYSLKYVTTMSIYPRIQNVSLNSCTSFCLSLAKTYAGIGRYCSCGQELVEAADKQSDSTCWKDCPDDQARTCGNEYSSYSVYEILYPNNKDLSTGPVASLSSDGRTDEDVWFLIGSTSGIEKYYLNGTTVAISTSNWVSSVDFLIRKNLLFIRSGSFIRRLKLDFNMSDNSSISVLSESNSGCNGFAVDWAEDRIYFAQCWDLLHTNITSIDIEGKHITHLLKRPGLYEQIDSMVIDPYEKILFWTVGNGIESCKVSGKDFRRISLEPGMHPTAFFLDPTVRRVYYVLENKDYPPNTVRGIFSSDYHGSDTQEHLHLAQRFSVLGLGVFKGYLYWFSMDNEYNKSFFKAPLSINDTTFIEIIKNFPEFTYTSAVNIFKIMHGDLQTTPSCVCKARGCSYGCDSTLKCICPEDFFLGNTGNTCYKLNDEASTSLIIIILSVQLAVGLAILMYKKCSKKNSRLQRRIKQRM